MIRAFFGFLVAVAIFAISVPMALIYLAGALFIATFAGFMTFVFLRALFFDVSMTTDPTTIWGWGFLGFCMLTAWSFMIWAWAHSLGLQHWFAKRRDSHGSARFASAPERAAYQTETGLLIGRDRGTGQLLRYDGPAHLLTLAPTKIGRAHV